jgi:protein arginine kinase activator
VFSEDSDWQMGGEDSRLCESCGEQPSTVHVTRIENGTVSHSHLCQNCAEELGEQNDGAAVMFAVPAALGRLFTNLMEKAADIQAGNLVGSPACAVCGTTLSDLRESGLLGCANCYRVFAGFLDDAPSPHGPVQAGNHLGKAPSRPAEGNTEALEVMRLQRMLRELVEHERFEEAASVRDRLAELEGSPSSHV